MNVVHGLHCRVGGCVHTGASCAVIVCIMLSLSGHTQCRVQGRMFKCVHVLATGDPDQIKHQLEEVLDLQDEGKNNLTIKLKKKALQGASILFSSMGIGGFGLLTTAFEPAGCLQGMMWTLWSAVAHVPCMQIAASFQHIGAHGTDSCMFGLQGRWMPRSERRR